MEGGSDKGDGKKLCGFGWIDVEFEVGCSVEDAMGSSGKGWTGKSPSVLMWGRGEKNIWYDHLYRSGRMRVQ